MRRRMVAPLAFAAAVALLLPPDPPRTAAQDPPAAPPAPVEETFLTADGVQLRGLFHPSAKNQAEAPVVILLYPPGMGNDMTKGEWKSLAGRLQTEGYNVFRFDWRGHGKLGTDIKAPMDFWTNRWTGPANNRFIIGANKRPLKSDLFFKDFGANAVKYAPVFLNDLAAARTHLDQKNDNGSVNTSSVYLIGSEGAAAIGFAWITAEWNRPAIHPQLLGGQTYNVVPEPNIVVKTEAGADVGGAVWLSAARPPSVPEATLKAWASKTPKLRDNNPMLFFHGEKDKAGKAQADFFFNEVLVANPRPGAALQKLDQTFIRDVKGTSLVGAALLGNNKELQTEDRIVAFLNQIQNGPTGRAKITVKKRNYASPYYIDLRFLGVMPPGL
jgi:pimeloyl-ACP methyl ester carboxylesterase